MKPHVSVVVTCYNYAAFIGKCLASIQNQTFADFEVIIVDDGSTDDSGDKVGAFLTDSRFRYIRQGNAGQANAKNRGVTETRADLIAFLDADDLWEADKLEKQIVRFADPAVGVVYSRARLIDDQGRSVELSDQGEYLRPRRGDVTRWLFLDNFLWFSSTMVRRICLDKHGTFDESLKMGIDWDLWLRISTEYDFDFVDEPLIAYRVGHSGQMSKNMETRQACADRIMQRFLDRHPGRVDTETIRRAYFSTYCSRGEYFRATKKDVSYRYFLKAMRINPLSPGPYKGIIKNLINWPA